MSQKINNIHRKHNKIGNIEDVLADIYDLILSKLDEENICKIKIA